MKDDELIRNFMKENCYDIPDNGFSKRVMQQLPYKTHKFSIIWNSICVLATLVLFITTDLFSEFFASIYLMIYNLLQFLSSPVTLVVFAAGIAILIISVILLYSQRSESSISKVIKSGVKKG